MTEDAVFEALALECRVDKYGTVRYFNTLGELHRVHGPAVEYSDGDSAWYHSGQRHRLDGPAVECTGGGGGKYWYQNGFLHREDGPAIIFEDGDKWWYINGKELTEAEFNQRVKNV